MTVAAPHRHKIEFKRRHGVTVAVCPDCAETLVDDVHAFAEAEEAAAALLPRADTINITLRVLIDRRLNRVH